MDFIDLCIHNYVRTCLVFTASRRCIKAPYVRALLFSVNPLPNDKIFDRSKLKESADDSFKFDENSRKFSKCIENTVGKGEIARYEQFLLFPQRFQKACFAGASKGVIVWEWVNPFLNDIF